MTHSYQPTRLTFASSSSSSAVFLPTAWTAAPLRANVPVKNSNSIWTSRNSKDGRGIASARQSRSSATQFEPHSSPSPPRPYRSHLYSTKRRDVDTASTIPNDAYGALMEVPLNPAPESTVSCYPLARSRLRHRSTPFLPPQRTVSKPSELSLTHHSPST